MKLVYDKKKMVQSTIQRGLSLDELREEVEKFWARVDAFCDRRDKRYRAGGGYRSVYYWFDRNTGDSYVGYDRRRGTDQRPKGPGVIY